MSIELDERGRALENEYFRRREQELIQKLKTKIAGENQTDAPERDCPKCDGNLVETAYENIKIDVCNSCQGVWLDAGEMAQILQKDEDAGGGWFGRVFK
jgi:predicted  nucleic acid-binding Zn ribbon protein